MGMEDKELIINGKWLNDNLVNGGQQLLVNKLPHLNGFQNVALGHTLAFEYRSRNSFKFCILAVDIADCGLFALANITTLAHGEQPASVVYDQKLMRRHYLQCLENLEIRPFPIIRGDVKIKAQFNIKLYCSCRLLCFAAKKMIQCNKCHEWYHLDQCEIVPTNILANKDTQWHCTECS